jgi:hypothetical protein
MDRKVPRIDLALRSNSVPMSRIVRSPSEKAAECTDCFHDIARPFLKRLLLDVPA